jgi:predicted RNA-binding protein with RPS1 domain
LYAGQLSSADSGKMDLVGNDLSGHGLQHLPANQYGDFVKFLMSNRGLGTVFISHLKDTYRIHDVLDHSLESNKILWK